MPKYAVFDGHNDIAWASRTKRGYTVKGLDLGAPELNTDLPRIAEGGLAGQFWSVWVDPVLEGAEQVVGTLEQIDFVHRFIAAYPDRLGAALTAAEAREVMASGRTASLIGIEGGAQIGGSLAVLRQFARLGARYMTLTWSKTTDWADSANDDAKHDGLSDFGREVVREMNRIGMIPDLAHVAPSTMRAAIEVSKYPVMISHSGASAVCANPRNVPDDVLKAVGESGGVVMAAFVPTFITEEERAWFDAGREGPEPVVSVSDVADHVDHIREVAGVHAVGIGSDFDGWFSWPQGLEDVSKFPALFEELERRGWSEDELRGLGTENVLRVLEASDGAYLDFLAGRAGQPNEDTLAPVVDTMARRAQQA